MYQADCVAANEERAKRCWRVTTRRRKKHSPSRKETAAFFASL